MAGLRLRKRFVVALAGALALWLCTQWWLRPTDERVFPRPPSRVVPAAARWEPAFDVPGAVPLDAPAPVPDDAAPHPLRATRTRLANGLTLIVAEDASTPEIAARVVIRAGAADDPEGLEGLAHLVEHGIHAGTDRLGTSDPAELLRLLDAIGASEVRSATTHDSTAFHALLPANALAPWAAAMHEALARPVFRAFQADRALVEEERRLRSAHVSPVSGLLPGLFPGHPYGRPIGGGADSVARIDLDAAARFAATWYVPDNAAVVLVGPVDPEAARAVVEQAFGAWTGPSAPVRGRLPGIVRGSEPVHVEAPGARQLGMGWAIERLDAAEVPALLVYAQALREEIVRRVPEDAALADLAVRLVRLRGADALVVEGECRAIEVCRSAVHDAVGRPPADLVGPGRPVANRAWVSLLRRLEAPELQAEALADAWVRGEAADAAWSTLRDLRAVDPAGVAAVVERTLRPGGAVVADAPGAPQDRTASEPAPDAVGQSAFWREVMAMPLPPLPPSWETSAHTWTETADGRILAVPNPANTLFEAALTWPVGWRTDPALCAALDKWLADGRSSATGAWLRTLDAAGVQVWLEECTWESVAVGLDGPGEYGPAALARVIGQVRDPKLDPRVTRESPDLWAAEHRWRSLLVGPIPEPVTGRSGARVLRAALRTFGAFGPDLRYTGPHAADELAGLLPAGPRTAPLPEVPWLLPGEDELRTEPGRHPGILAVRASEPYDPAREAVYRLYDAWLSGPRGIVAETVLRGGASAWSYRIRYVRGRFPGERNHVRVELPTRHVEEAAGLVLDALVAPFDEGRYARARRATEVDLWAGHVAFREAPAVLQRWRDQGHLDDARAAAWEGLRTVDAGAFAAFLDAERAEPIRLIARGPELGEGLLNR